MELITKEDLEKLPGIGETDGTDAIVYVKIFHPCGSYTAYVTEYDPKSEQAFGLVCNLENELGYFSIKEMRETEVFGLGFERDICFKPRKLSEIMKEVNNE